MPLCWGKPPSSGRARPTAAPRPRRSSVGPRPHVRNSSYKDRTIAVTGIPNRRSFLLAAASLALAGCAPASQEIGAHRTPGTDGAAPHTPGGASLADGGELGIDTAAAPAIPADLHPADLPAPPATMPTRADVTTAFAGHAPKYWGLEAPGVLSRLPATAPGVALTIDFCGGPNGTGADLALLALLRQQQVPATLFLNWRWITANPSLAKDLAADPLFEFANHGTTHRPLSVTGRSAYGITGTANPGEVYDEIMANDARLTELTGHRPRYFRPGTAYLDEVAADIVRSLGLVPVGFSVNGDGGATFPAPTVTREVSRAHTGDIVILHGNRPGGGTAAGLVRALAAMKDRGETFRPLPKETS